MNISINIGKLVWDYALGKTGIVIDGPWVEFDPSIRKQPIHWEWLVLYDDGEFMGADTSDLKDQS
jgi:hypothetical protein